MSCTRIHILNIAKYWLGCNEEDGSHKQIIDLYNSHKPLARGYKVKYTDAWCATFVSAVAIKAGATDIIPTECGCQKMIALFKKIGCWREDENYIPEPGDILFYDWNDSGKGDCTGWSDHVGIVEKVVDNKITIIEGNKSNSVKRVTKSVNGRYIRGYGLPKYSEETSEENKKEEKEEIIHKVATRGAKTKDNKIQGNYITTGKLYLRNGAGITYKPMCVIPKNTVVRNYGYYTLNGSRKWLYITFKMNGIKYTGFSSEKYLKKL